MYVTVASKVWRTILLEKNESGSKIFEKILPFCFTIFIIAADQASKAVIARNWVEGTIVKDVFGNGVLQIWHVRNKLIAFSLGGFLPDVLRPVFFIALPLAVLAFLVWYYWKSSEFTRIQRWVIAGIIGGGLGNLIDRIFRPAGVVDFISVKFYGLFGFERWPTFNIADSSVVVCVIIWLVSFMFIGKSWKVGANDEG
jgi:signal peptidase II